ncbi:MAG: prolipoprotein diacylglyceryl transferase [Cryomorphaceae bacterium]
MHPILIELGNFTIYAYGFMIVVGATLAYFFLSNHAKRQYDIHPDKISTLLVWIFVAAFVGGKVFFYLEEPEVYIDDPSAMWDDIGNGFVFFGSLLFAVPTTIWFFIRNKWNVWGMLDLLAFTTLIVHAFGRLGCFLAGCCHGLPTHSGWGITFTDPYSQAEPLGVPLHPTQLYSFAMLTVIFLTLYFYRAKKQFDGQLFILYVMLYSIGRSMVEVFRGDEARGYVIEGWVTHSQFISFILILAMIALYVWRHRKYSNQ